MVSNSPVTFQRTLAFVFVLLLYVLEGNTNAAQAGDFGFRFEVGDCLTERLDTFNGVFTKNLGGDPKPYDYRMLGQVATLGRYKGIADVLGLRLRGFPGWFVTRSYHLVQLPLVSRRLRVVADWTTSLFFKRDIAELGTIGHPQGLRDG